MRRLAREAKAAVRGAVAAGGRAAAERATGRSYVALTYPPNAENAPRHVPGRPNPALERLLAPGIERYRSAIATIARHADAFRSIPVHDPGDPARPRWVNGFLPGLDGAALYAFAREQRAATYVEVGSGNSTRFVRQACRDGALDTRIVSIDPFPRAEIDALCDEVVRRPLERADLSVFARLTGGDMVFFDGSHQTFMGNDVAVFFGEVLPALAPGVLVGIHDVYLPFDYPVDIADRYYSEQYVLAAWLLGRRHADDVLLPAQYAYHGELRPEIDALWRDPHFAGVEGHGVALWMTTAPA
jgi:hypothetical protein